MSSHTPERGTSGGVVAQRLVRHLDLFSGIGGFALAARMVGGIETVGFSEIEPYACRVLAKNFPNVKNYGDIRSITGISADLITAGWPCQPHSSAGKRGGKNDDRYLWPEALRVVQDSRPRWFLGENVAGIISVELDQVLADLEEADYTATAFSIPAVALDAPHGRPRWWVVGNSNGPSAHPHPATRPPRKGGKATSEPSRWPTEPAICRISDGVSTRLDSLRCAGLGNAIVPQVAAEILRAMMSVDCMTNTATMAGDEIALPSVHGSAPRISD